MTSKTTDAATKAPTRDDLLKQAYQAANKALRENHRDEFIAAYQAEAQARGVEYTPKPTAEEKAAAQLATLLEQFPHLAPGADTPNTTVVG